MNKTKIIQFSFQNDQTIKVYVQFQVRVKKKKVLSSVINIKSHSDNQASLHSQPNLCWRAESNALDTQDGNSPHKRLLPWLLMLQHSVCVAPLKT